MISVSVNPHKVEYSDLLDISIKLFYEENKLVFDNLAIFF